MKDVPNPDDFEDYSIEVQQQYLKLMDFLEEKGRENAPKFLTSIPTAAIQFSFAYLEALQTPPILIYKMILDLAERYRKEKLIEFDKKPP